MSAERDAYARDIAALMRAVNDPGSIIPRDGTDTDEGMFWETLGKWQARALLADGWTRDHTPGGRRDVAEEVAREIEKQRDDCAKVWSGRRATYTFCAIIARQVGAR